MVSYFHLVFVNFAFLTLCLVLKVLNWQANSQENVTFRYSRETIGKMCISIQYYFRNINKQRFNFVATCLNRVMHHT